MSINLDKYRDELISAWRDVLDNKTATDWALFAYEGQTNILKFISKGSQGLEELAEDLNSGKIMYAFCKVNDSSTSLDKFILLNWQGEGANTLRKGISANHLRDIEKFFTGAQLTISARNEDEVEPQFILDKVSKAGSAYSFKSVKSDVIEPTGPIGTVYKRVNPGKEINSLERDQFWRREEEEEKKRVEEEKQRREVEKVTRDEEVRKREALDSAKRGEQEAKSNQEDEDRRRRELEAKARREEASREASKDTEVEVRVNKSEQMRKERKREADELIAQRTVNAKAIFEQNTVVSQKKVPDKPVRNSILKAQALQSGTNNAETNEPAVELKTEEASDDDSDQFSTIKRSPKDPEKKYSQHEEEAKNGVEVSKSAAVQHYQPQQMTVENLVDELIYDFNSPGLQARALYDYQAADDTEITFNPGDILTNIDQVDEGWWQGLAPNGTYGLFPANYVELI